MQLYVRDPVATVTRPIKALKGYKRLRLQPEQSATVTFNGYQPSGRRWKTPRHNF